MNINEQIEKDEFLITYRDIPERESIAKEELLKAVKTLIKIEESVKLQEAVLNLSVLRDKDEQGKLSYPNENSRETALLLLKTNDERHRDLRIERDKTQHLIRELQTTIEVLELRRKIMSDIIKYLSPKKDD